jgi:indole-3-glycerol phosphate synthase
VDIPSLHKVSSGNEQQIEESATAVLGDLVITPAGNEADGRLIEKAMCCGLETLVEAHSLAEIKKVEDLSFDLMGINNRDLPSSRWMTTMCADGGACGFCKGSRILIMKVDHLLGGSPGGRKGGCDACWWYGCFESGQCEKIFWMN